MKTIVNVLINPNVNNSSYTNFLNKSDYFEFKFHNFDINSNKNTYNFIDMVLFTGGEDVSPSFYNDKCGKYTSYNSNRDNFESKMFNAVNNNVLKLGICRGAQFLTVMSGGELIQHVENHTSSHQIEFNYKKIIVSSDYKYFNVTSTHHQMMYPFKLNEKEYDILGFSTYFLSDKYRNGSNLNKNIKNINFVESEIVHYKNSNSLCIQGHPEFDSSEEKFKIITHYLIKKFL